MKRYTFLIILFTLCWGCCKEKEDVGIECDAGYTWEFVVKNGTGDKVIIITAESPYETGYPKLLAIAPGENDPITAFEELGPCGRQTVLDRDIFRDDLSVVPISGVINGSNYFTMTIDGEAISDAIWLLKHWLFEPDYDNYYRASYTLTVTDELLNLLSAPPDEDE
jgi:hypothetical protein